MPKLTIRTDGDPVLRQVAKPIKRISSSIKTLLSDMAEAMYEAEGVGLAAPQVGVSKRAIVIDVGEGLIELINPELVDSSDTQNGVEGCLSIPGVAGEVERLAKVTVCGLDRDGRQTWVEGEGLLARALQHEIDHLDGILFKDKASRTWETSQEASDDGDLAADGEAGVGGDPAADGEAEAGVDTEAVGMADRERPATATDGGPVRESITTRAPEEK